MITNKWGRILCHNTKYMEVSSLSPSLVEKYAFLKPVTLDEAIKLKVCGVHISAMAEEHINELTLES